MLTYVELKKEDSTAIEELILKTVNEKEKGHYTYSKLSNLLNISDIFIYEVLKKHNLEDYVISNKKKIDFKHEIVTYVLEEPYARDITDVLGKFKANHNQLVAYLEEEGIREFVPNKFGKIKYNLIKFLKEHPQEYSTQEVIEMLKLNKKTFYKIYNDEENAEMRDLFRKVSKNCKKIISYLEETNQKGELTYHEIGKKLGLTTIVVKNNLIQAGLENWAKHVVTKTQIILDFVNKHKNEYTLTELANELDMEYNTIYRVLQRNDLLDSVKKPTKE